jgi:membrane-bound ClpP family serine protease
MRNLPPEPGHQAGGGGSVFADFISRLQPYPPPPGFQATLLYAVAGAILLLIAGIASAALPTDLEGDGFHAIGASLFGSLLEVFNAPAPVFAVFGLVGLVVVVTVGVRRRLSETPVPSSRY